MTTTHIEHEFTHGPFECTICGSEQLEGHIVGRERQLIGDCCLDYAEVMLGMGWEGGERPYIHCEP
jgi:hypothetical protein